MALPSLGLPPSPTEWPPDPITASHFYRWLLARRCLAFFIDIAMIGLILVIGHWLILMASVATFGLFSPLHLLLVPLVVALPYHALQEASSAQATLGMRLFGVRAHCVLGGRLTLGQALIHTICLYGTLAFSGGLLMLFPLFNGKKRALHDFLAGAVVLRDW